MSASPDRPRALVLAPLRGEGKDILESVCDIVYEPWIEEHPIKLYNPEDLAAKIAEVGATVLVCESASWNTSVSPAVRSASNSASVDETPSTV